MPIIKHIPIYYVPKKFLSYVTNANWASMKMCRKISDEVALAHGLKIIEHPKYNVNLPYSIAIA